jgi:membrane fusion protein, multidrug efflux system
MRCRFVLLLAVEGLALLLLVPSVRAQDAPSALVQVMPLQMGSLPRRVTVYGSIEANASARKAVVAPLSALIGDVYVRQGETVSKGAKLLRLVPSPQTAASYDQAQSALRVATDLVARTRKLVGQHLATRQQLAEAEKSEADARSALRALQAQGANGSNVLRAPFAAVVTMLAVSPGTMVSVGTNLLDLAQPQHLILKAGIVPAQAAEVKAGDVASITLLGSGPSASGRVLFSGAAVNSIDGLVPIEIALPPNKFLPGEMAEAVITTGEVKGYVVPHSAILADERGNPYVMQAIKMVAKKVAVRVLDAAGDKDVIAGLLDATSPLVLAGNYQLQDGMKIRLADPNGKKVP